MIIVYLILLSQRALCAIDKCLEHQSYLECISSDEVYCTWDYVFDQCKESDNYLIGCSIYINKIGCISQLGSSIAKVALCKFDGKCQQITDLEEELCSNNLNRYGCLAIRNPYSICKWENHQCLTVTGQDILNIQQNFNTVYYSSNACQYIKNYLIIHHTILWDILLYEPDLVKEANEFILNSTKNLDQDLSLLQNSYSRNKNFKQFVFGNKYQIEFNRYRLGCNAIDISDDDDFNLLINNLQDSFGVNHVYCKYLEQKENYMIFLNGRCQQVEPEILATTQFIDDNDIQCIQLSHSLCSTYKSELRKCYIPNTQDEYTCVEGVQKFDLSANCMIQKTQEPYYRCEQFKYCYFDINKQYCSDFCYDRKKRTECLSSDNCLWSGQDENEQNDLLSCTPLHGCNQLGLDLNYCKYLQDYCDWQNGRCLSMTEEYAFSLRCEQAFNKYVCLIIQKSDQQCIWYDEKCINFIDYELKYLFNTIPLIYKMNRNMCINFKKDNFMFDPINYQCVYQTQLQISCNNRLINKFHCYNIVNDLCKWDDYQNQCVSLLNSDTYYCDDLKNVSFRVCLYAKVKNSQNYCLYDWDLFSCYEGTSQANLLQQEADCYNMNVLKQFRQWNLGKCVELSLSEVNNIQCISWRNVNRNVCVSNVFNNQPCIYDEKLKLCYNDVIISYCSSNLNRFACVLSTSKCYYDILNDLCKEASADLLKELGCTSYVSKSACQYIETLNQKCMWDSFFQECRIYDQVFQFCNQFSINRQACTSQKAPLSIQYHQNNYCQFNENTYTCDVNNNIISDCGTNLSINLHRCVYYSTGTCIYDQYKCFDISNVLSRLDLLYLNEILCEQANLATCSQITNPSQGCQFRNITRFDYLDYLCQNQDRDSFACKDVSMTVLMNKGICSKAKDNCYYQSSTSKCAAYSSTSPAYCNTLAISLKGCVQVTVGKCIFFQDQCQYFTDHNTAKCELRNYQACISSNYLKCTHSSQTNLCSSSTSTIDCTNRYDGILTHSWATCSMSSQDCYGFNSQCKVGKINDVPCDLPGLSYSVCKSLNMYCEFINGYCQFQIQRQCNEITEKEECVNNKIKDKYCVFHKDKCFNVADISNILCNQYNYTSFHFCKRFEDCSYDFTTNVCYQNSIIKAISLDCLDNNSNNIMYKYVNNECVQIQQDLPNCLAIQNIQTNYNLCQSISNNDNNNCAYDLTTHLCKLTYYSRFQNCSEILTEIQCIYANLICYANYTNSVFQSCTSTSQASSSKINRFGCLQNQTGTYLFKNEDWVCQLISITTENLKLLQFSNQLNQKACFVIGSIYSQNLYLRWQNNECVKLTFRQSMNLSTCTNLNKNACLAVSRLNCIWNINDNVCSEDTITKFVVTSCESQVTSNSAYLNSQGQCSKISVSGLRCIQKSTNKGCESLSTTTYKSVFKCTGLGLNREACLMETKLTLCFWGDGLCDDANFELLRCQDDVSEYTCKSITKQNCQWKNSQCSIKIEDFSSCELSNGYLSFCLNNVNLKCKYNQQINSCESFSYTPLECDNTYSKFACRNVINKTCQWNNNQCQELLNITSCNPIYNQQSCLLNDKFSCTWDGNKGCIDFIADQKFNYFNLPATANKYVCLNYSIQETAYTSFKCTNILSYNQIRDKSSIDLGQPITNSQCQNQMNITTCLSLHTLNTYCKWNQNYCIDIVDDSTFSTLTCNSDINIWACLKITNPTQNCKWSNQKCLNFQPDDKSLINVNINVCINYTKNMIYQNHSCISQLNIQCNSLGISKYTCINNQNYACQYINNQCVNFQILSNYNQCSDITNVSLKACQMIPQLQCQYGNNNNCVNYKNNNQLEGISKQACLSKSGFYYWQNNQCKQIDRNLECDDDLQVTQQSCVLITNKKCLYNKSNQTCTSIYNLHQLSCSTSGLNKLGCMSVLYEPCIFKNNQCQKLNNVSEFYIQLKNVNEYSCRMLVNDYVEYNEFEQRCTYQLTKTKCYNLNVNACNSLSYCQWNPDLQKCGCNVSTQICYNFNKNECLQQSQCYYQNSICQLKQCYHLSENDCSGQILNNLKCYLNRFKQCTQASKCEDIIDSFDCQDIYFNGTACLQIQNASQCYSYNNFELICKYSTECLNQYCIYDGNCRLKQCADIQNQEECQFTKNCSFINNKCQLIKSCQQITDATICNQLTIENTKCNWQQQNLLENIKICTSQPCYMLGTSTSLCHGNEINNFSCILNNYKCIQCEQIQESCECNSYKGICYYNNNLCTSLLCSDLITSQICQQSPKCEWSQSLNQCTLLCKFNYDIELCQNRKNECHWNQYIRFCQTGPESIPTLFNPTKQSLSYQYHLLLTFFIILYL